MNKKYLNRRTFIAFCISLIATNVFANDNNITSIKKGKNMSIFHIGTLSAKPESVDALIKSLSVVSQQKGCISHKIFRDTENPNKIISHEEWEKKEDHDNFVGAFSEEEMGAWLGMLSREPEGSFYMEL